MTPAARDPRPTDEQAKAALEWCWCRPLEGGAIDSLASLLERRERVAVEVALRSRESHGQPCYYCGKPTDDLAGDPGQWGVGLSHMDAPGVLKWHHAGCMAERLVNRTTIERAARIKALIDAWVVVHEHLEHGEFFHGGRNDCVETIADELAHLQREAKEAVDVDG